MTANDVHGRVSDQFSAYVENDLPPADKAQVDQHLATCIQCRTDLERFRATIGGLSKLKHKAPGDFLPAIQQQIHVRSRGRFFGKRWLLFGRIPFEWISLLMIVAMLVYYIITMMSSPTTVTPG
jgi:anti-sigma factor RsiW